MLVARCSQELTSPLAFSAERYHLQLFTSAQILVFIRFLLAESAQGAGLDGEGCGADYDLLSPPVYLTQFRSMLDS